MHFHQPGTPLPNTIQNGRTPHCQHPSCKQWSKLDLSSPSNLSCALFQNFSGTTVVKALQATPSKKQDGGKSRRLARAVAIDHLRPAPALPGGPCFCLKVLRNLRLASLPSKRWMSSSRENNPPLPSMSSKHACSRDKHPTYIPSTKSDQNTTSKSRGKWTKYELPYEKGVPG